MRHFFRLNQAEEGYALYSGGVRQGFRSQPLDISSTSIPLGFLQAQRRLDDLFSSRQPTVSVSLQYPATGKPVVAYGSLFSGLDERGRPGLVFIQVRVVNYQHTAGRERGERFLQQPPHHRHIPVVQHVREQMRVEP